MQAREVYLLFLGELALRKVGTALASEKSPAAQ